MRWFFLAALLTTALASAHGGRTDKNGCHRGKVEGFHCHGYGTPEPVPSASPPPLVVNVDRPDAGFISTPDAGAPARPKPPRKPAPAPVVAPPSPAPAPPAAPPVPARQDWQTKPTGFEKGLAWAFCGCLGLMLVGGAIGLGVYVKKRKPRA